MQTVINIANDLLIIIGNIVIFSTMLNFKELKKSKKIIVLSVCTVLLLAYTTCVYYLNVPYIHATLMCFTIPTLILFWCISDIKDSRFFLTFCLVDTVSLIIAAVTKFFSFKSKDLAPYITLITNIIIYSLIIGFGFKFFVKYAQLLKFQKAGWRSMMIASFVIYFALYFMAAYPIPLKDRLEYAPTYFVFSGVVLSCYVVFLDSIIKTKKLYEQNEELEKEKEFHKIAYCDPLTGLYNRVYYVEKINELERNCKDYENVCCIVIDMNNFKSINDNYGHHMGDLILQDTANHISDIFKGLRAFIFRISGDEFYLLIPDANEIEVKDRLDKINGTICHNSKLNFGDELSVACGYSFINIKSGIPNISIEENFMQADMKMYENKKKYKTEHNIE